MLPKSLTLQGRFGGGWVAELVKVACTHHEERTNGGGPTSMVRALRREGVSCPDVVMGGASYITNKFLCSLHSLEVLYSLFMSPNISPIP